MAARRLVAVMVVLLAISTIVAALAPRQPGQDPEPAGRGKAAGARPSGPAAEPAPEGSGEVRARVRVSNRPAKVIRLRPGQQLQLAVSGTFGDDIEIPALGRVETMSRFAPAVFDIYAREAGTFGVEAVGADRLVAKIVVSAVPGPGSGPAGSGAHDVERSGASRPESK